MKSSELKRALDEAVKAARAAGALMRKNQWSVKKVEAVAQHDIKLELDIRCQKLIEKRLRAAFPTVALLGEEGVMGDPQAGERWVVDPIDGTVNFAYGIPHACVSIALQSSASVQESGNGLTASSRPSKRHGISASAGADKAYQTMVGVVFDPFCDELWTAIRGQTARLNGRPIRTSQRAQLSEAVIALGFAKYEPGLRKLIPRFQQLIHRVRKIRIMGAAALDLVYVASGRIDAYVESGVRLWDIAAGGLIIECAGGEFWYRQLPGEHVYHVLANNGRLRNQLEYLAKK